MRPKAGADIAIDAILFQPGTFRPNGTTMPDGINFALPPSGKKKKR